MTARVFIAAMTALLVMAGYASAGVVSSQHDLAVQHYTRLPGKDEKKEKPSVCDSCHVPHKAKGARVWANTPPSIQAWGDVSPICYSCHDGVAIVSPDVDASTTVYNPKSHGLDIEKLPEGDDVEQSGLPYTGGDTQQNIECSTCHNPHDNSKRPFVREELIELCTKCHNNRENSGYNVANEEGTHPVHKLPEDEVAGMSPIDVQEPFKVKFPDAYPEKDGKMTDKVHWKLGGHLSGGDEGTIECVTCHSVHGIEPNGPPGDPVLAMDPVKEESNDFCEGCHRGMRSDGRSQPPFPNPGGTPFYHPVDNDIANGEGRVVEVEEPEGWELGKAGEIICTTCHQAHGSMAYSPMLRQPLVSNTFCEECHRIPFSHHPSNGSGGLMDPSSGKLLAKTRLVIIPDDVPIGITYGQPEDGQMYCSSCHGAHNLQCKLLRVAECVDRELDCNYCLTCHPKFNPTWQTNDEFKSTHFMGDPESPYMDTVDLTSGQVDQPDGQDGYYDLHPPVNTGVWPETGLASRYGGDSGFEITCCSCHNFSPGNMTAGNADETPYSGDPVVAAGYIETDLTSGLLARAGQFKEWLEGDVQLQDLGGNRGTVQKADKYLCTGCHGLTPNSQPDAQNGEGLTHPLMSANGASINPLDDYKFTYNQHINCETCHSVHEADSRGGFYILKDLELRPEAAADYSVPEPYRIRKRAEIEYASLCHKCHIDY